MSTEYQTIKEIDGFRIETLTEVTCVTCLIASGDDSYGTVVNEDAKMILVYKVIVVEQVDCAQDDHDDAVTMSAIHNLIKQGKVEQVVIDGVTKYRAIK